MPLIPLADEAWIHRQVYIATLRGVLRSSAQHKEFAPRVDISRGYLQYVLQPFNPRSPGPATAERIARALPMTRQEQDDVLEHMLLAGERRLRAWRAAQQVVNEASPRDVLESIRAAHWTATYSADPSEAGAAYVAVRDRAIGLLSAAQAAPHRLLVVEACLLAHDAQSVANRTGEALYYAMAAEAIMGRLSRQDYTRDRPRFDHLKVNALYAKCVSLNSLGAINQADLAFQAAAAVAATTSAAQDQWGPHINRSRIGALSARPRFRLYEIEGLVEQVRRGLDRQADALTPQFALLTDVSLARAYLRHGSDLSLRKAARLLAAHETSVSGMPLLGPLRKVVTLKELARLSRAIGDVERAYRFSNEAIAVATAAGLDHQVGQLRRELGPIARE